MANDKSFVYIVPIDFIKLFSSSFISSTNYICSDRGLLELWSALMDCDDNLIQGRVLEVVNVNGTETHKGISWLRCWHDIIESCLKRNVKGSDVLDEIRSESSSLLSTFYSTIFQKEYKWSFDGPQSNVSLGAFVMHKLLQINPSLFTQAGDGVFQLNQCKFGSTLSVNIQISNYENINFTLRLIHTPDHG